MNEAGLLDVFIYLLPSVFPLEYSLCFFLIFFFLSWKKDINMSFPFPLKSRWAMLWFRSAQCARIIISFRLHLLMNELSCRMFCWIVIFHSCIQNNTWTHDHSNRTTDFDICGPKEMWNESFTYQWKLTLCSWKIQNYQEL